MLRLGFLLEADFIILKEIVKELKLPVERETRLGINISKEI